MDTPNLLPVWLPNLGSLVLGLAAWLLPALGMAGRRPTPVKTAALAAGSFCACALSLLLVLLHLKQVTAHQDWSALMDTLPAFCLAASVLLIVALALNLLAILRHWAGPVRAAGLEGGGCRG